MSDREMMHQGHETPPPEKDQARGWRSAVKSRYFAIGVAAVLLLAGFFLARQLGIGGRLLPGIGFFAVMMGGHFLMHSPHGGQGSHGAHGGCGSSHETPKRRTSQQEGVDR